LEISKKLDLPEFWRWSLKTYEYDGVSEKLILLQDQFDLNVNILLWTSWCATSFNSIPEFALRQAIEATQPWNEQVTTSIRTARIHSKKINTQPPEFYDILKKAELLAEKFEQDCLENLATKFLTCTNNPSPHKVARSNITRYLTLTNISRKPGFSVELIESLLGSIFPQSNDEIEQ